MAGTVCFVWDGAHFNFKKGIKTHASIHSSWCDVIIAQLFYVAIFIHIYAHLVITVHKYKHIYGVAGWSIYLQFRSKFETF